jgi:hypothetical protein
MSWINQTLVAEVLRSVFNARNSWRAVDQQMPKVYRAFDKVRNELFEVGLLAEDEYLDQIDLVVSPLPSSGEAGYVFEDLGFLPKLVGYKEGVIYIPSDVPHTAYVPGGTLTDTIRHEFGHAWHWLESEFFERPWFVRAFGSSYDDPSSAAFHVWEEKLGRKKNVLRDFEKLRTDRSRAAFYRKELLLEFVSGYAATQPCEDFAETFMFYLRNRKSVNSFQDRPGVYRKIKAVERAVKVARKELGL